MIKYDLNKMKGGWFIGKFSPSLYITEDFEVAIKKYKKGDYESRHFHKIATEYTVIVEGIALMNEILLKKDEIMKVMPGESTDFKALEETTTLVVKIPSIKNDKYLS